MKQVRKRWLVVLMTLAMVFTAMPLAGGKAFAEGKNVGTITLDLTKGRVSLSGDKLAAFDNVMGELKKAHIVYYDSQLGYDINNATNNRYDMDRDDKEDYTEFYVLEDTDLEGTWSRDIDESIKNTLSAEGKAYCDKISIVFPEAPEVYDVWIEGKRVNEANAADIKGDKTVTYDAATKTLTLNGATLEIESTDGSSHTAIRANDTLNIKLVGTNKIVNNQLYSPSYTYGIDANELHIFGTGSLDISFTAKMSCYGIHASHGLTVDGAKITTDVTLSSSVHVVVGANSSDETELKNGASLKVVSHGAGNSVMGLQTDELSVDQYSMLEAFGDGDDAIAVEVNNAKIDAGTISRGAMVNQEAKAEGASEWDKTSALTGYKYVRMPINHVHFWDGGKVTRQPTAEKAGEMLYTCTACGATRTEAISNAAQKAAKYTPGKATLKKVKKQGRKLTATWKTMKNVTGYQVQFTNKKTKKAKSLKVKQTKKLAKKKTISKGKKLPKGKYKVRVRAYRTVNGETFYGAWSKTKIK